MDEKTTPNRTNYEAAAQARGQYANPPQNARMQDVVPPQPTQKPPAEQTVTPEVKTEETPVSQPAKRPKKRGGIVGMVIIGIGFVGVVAQTTFIMLAGGEPSQQNILILCGALGVMLTGCMAWSFGRRHPRR